MFPFLSLSYAPAISALSIFLSHSHLFIYFLPLPSFPPLLIFSIFHTLLSLLISNLTLSFFLPLLRLSTVHGTSANSHFLPHFSYHIWHFHVPSTFVTSHFSHFSTFFSSQRYLFRHFHLPACQFCHFRHFRHFCHFSISRYTSVTLHIPCHFPYSHYLCYFPYAMSLLAFPIHQLLQSLLIYPADSDTSHIRRYPSLSLWRFPPAASVISHIPTASLPI
jgi:hypothetical protein